VKIFICHISDKGLMPFKELIQLDGEKFITTNNLIKNGRRHTLANRYMKRCSVLLIIRKCESEPL
jgi:hypothetical protein